MAKKPIAPVKPPPKNVKTPAPISRSKTASRRPLDEDEDEETEEEEEDEEEEEEEEDEEEEGGEEEEEEEPAPVAKKKSAVNQKAVAVPTGAVGPDYWANVFNSLESGGNSNFIFPKNGKLKVRLLQKKGDPFFTEVDSTYMNKTKKKYMVLAWAPGTQDAENNPSYEVKGLVLPKTAWKAITGLLAEGYDFFGRKTGYGVTIVRTGQMRDTSYNVMPSKNPQPLPPQLIEALAATSLEDMAENFSQMMTQRSGDSADTQEQEDWS